MPASYITDPVSTVEIDGLEARSDPRQIAANRAAVSVESYRLSECAAGVVVDLKGQSTQYRRPDAALMPAQSYATAEPASAPCVLARIGGLQPVLPWRNRINLQQVR